jgi:hypothetical protein
VKTREFLEEKEIKLLFYQNPASKGNGLAACIENLHTLRECSMPEKQGFECYKQPPQVHALRIFADNLRILATRGTWAHG